MDRKYGSRRTMNLPVLVTLTSIGLLLCFAGALMTVFDIGSLSMRISLGYIGLFIFATSYLFARTISQ